MSDIILVYPCGSYLDSVNRKPYLPLSLLSASSYLAKYYNIKIIDLRIDKNWKLRLKRELSRNPICVGITAQTGNQITVGLEVSKFVKENNKEIPVVWGGVHPTLLPGQTLKHPNIDIVVEGEGELIFDNLVKALENRKPLKSVKGIWYKVNSKILQNQPEILVDLDKLPDMPYHILNLKNYIMNFNGRTCLPVETSRGCYGNCTFCYNRSSPYRRIWRPMGVEKTIERIRQLSDAVKFDVFEIVDDNFFIDIKRAKGIAEGLVKESVDKSWWAGGVRTDSVLRMDPDYFTTLEKSGCIQLNPGVESGSERILKLMRKGITVCDVLKASSKINKTNIVPYYTFMGGFPTETIEDIKKTVMLASRLLRSNPKTKISVYHIFRPLPNTQLFELAKQYGFKAPSTLEEWAEYDLRYNDFPWLSAETKRMVSALHFISLFVDNKCDQTDSALVKVFTKLYRPLARYRFYNFNFNLMLEHRLLDLF